MSEATDKAVTVLTGLVEKAASGIDSAVAFSQAQIPDVVSQLLVFEMVQSVIIFVFGILLIVLFVIIAKKQFKLITDGVVEDGYSWQIGKTKYKQTLIFTNKGEIGDRVIIVFFLSFLWMSASLVMTLGNLTWLKIWLAPKLYLLEYAASLVK